MHLFNANEKLKKYNTVNEIIEDYYVVRLEYYKKRREYLIETYENELVYISNKAKFITDILSGLIDLRRMKNDMIVQLLIDKKYHMKDNDNFEYLIGMPMKSVSEENVNKLWNELDKKEYELNKLKKTTKELMWLNELAALKDKYIEFSNISEKKNKISKSKKNLLIE